MYAPLSDIVTCPRCGPAFGLVLLAERTELRRVLEGWLGCANCRERFRVRAGFAELRFNAGVGEREGGGEGRGGGPDALRLAALLGVTEGPALVLLAGAVAANAAAIADMLEGVEVVAAWQPLENEEERAGVSRFASSAGLPFRTGTMRAVAVSDPGLIEEAARVAAARARVVVFSEDSSAVDVVQRLERSGLRVLAQDEHATVAERPLF